MSVARDRRLTWLGGRTFRCDKPHISADGLVHFPPSWHNERTIDWIVEASQRGPLRTTPVLTNILRDMRALGIR